MTTDKDSKTISLSGENTVNISYLMRENVILLLRAIKEKIANPLLMLLIPGKLSTK